MSTAAVMNYCAGFFDGEGAIMISLNKGKYVRIEIACSQNTVEVPSLFERTFGGRVYEYKGMYQWKIFGKKGVVFLNAITPFLIIKHVSALEAMDAWEHRKDVEYVERILRVRADKKAARRAAADSW